MNIFFKNLKQTLIPINSVLYTITPSTYPNYKLIQLWKILLVSTSCSDCTTCLPASRVLVYLSTVLDLCNSTHSNSWFIFYFRGFNIYDINLYARASKCNIESRILYVLYYIGDYYIGLGESH